MDEKVFLDDISHILQIRSKRRSFFRNMMLGSAGAAFASLTSSGGAEAAAVDAGESTVSLVRGRDRRDMVYQAMKPLEEEIRRGIRGKQVMIKVNMVGNETNLGVTHPDAVRGVLDFLKPMNPGTVEIAESTGRRYRDLPGTIKHFHLYRYFPLIEEYGVKLIDLNAQEFTTHWLVGPNGEPWDIRVMNQMTDPNRYIISVTRLKTHNCMVVTLSAKNMLMGAPVVDSFRHDKSRMHTPGLRKMNMNFFLLSRAVKPHLSVLDGLEGMEGNGPNNGTPVRHGVALAGTDWVAVDSIGAQLMGVDVWDVGYLTYATNGGLGQGDRSKIRVIGEDPTRHIMTYRMHDNFWGGDDGESQLSWKYTTESVR